MTHSDTDTRSQQYCQLQQYLLAANQIAACMNLTFDSTIEFLLDEARNTLDQETAQ
ncbi:hypothetical protein UFOVP642_4 [uncultured Caudovirales phage]|uniref:Uncharacterized protein n=1 Tax=uncultured Caudovirales phage TaxID=2100421 RepID=A0A6J5N5R8_9CAUD|nr:hypothetical protein UFOVP642_4 [uncultured Caudovirales phage]